MSAFALVCASDFASDDFSWRHEKGAFDTVLAVDSGYAHLERLRIVPDVVLGDFDSLGYVPERALVHPAIKDKSDLELALDYALENGADEIVAYGCLGGRLDHTLAALQNMAAVAEAGVRIRAIGSAWGDESKANSRRRRQYAVEALAGPSTLLLHVAQGAVAEQVDDLGAPTYGSVSVFSAADKSCGVTEEGMFYPLEHEVLTNRTSMGLSNELVVKQGKVSVESGTLFVIYPADLTSSVSRSC